MLSVTFAMFYVEISNYEDEFLNYKHISVKSFDKLVGKIIDIRAKDRTM